MKIFILLFAYLLLGAWAIIDRNPLSASSESAWEAAIMRPDWKVQEVSLAMDGSVRCQLVAGSQSMRIEMDSGQVTHQPSRIQAKLYRSPACDGMPIADTVVGENSPLETFLLGIMADEMELSHEAMKEQVLRFDVALQLRIHLERRQMTFEERHKRVWELKDKFPMF